MESGFKKFRCQSHLPHQSFNNI